MKKNIIITLGSIPSKLDIVKYISNRFAGQSMITLANQLSSEYDITLVKWKYNKIDTNGYEFVDVDDVMDYQEKVLDMMKSQIDTKFYNGIILGAAVANFMPSRPFKGKINSRAYSNKKLTVEFELCPRIINKIKEVAPYKTLIGFKCSDKSYLDAIALQKESKADVVIWNHPDNLKDVVVVHKTGYYEHKNRSEMVNDIITAIESKPTVTTEYKQFFIDGNFDISKVLGFMELVKYAVDEEGHGSASVISDGRLYISKRGNNKKLARLHSDKISNGAKTLLEFHNRDNILSSYDPVAVSKSKYAVHSHRPRNAYHFDKSWDVEFVSYIPAGCEIKDKFTEQNIAYYSKNAGWFLFSNSIVDMLKVVSDRCWNNYNPPKRYIREHEIVDNSYYIGAGNNISQIFNIDPYFSEECFFENCMGNREVFFLNSLPIVGLDIFAYIVNIFKTIRFNIPKQYDTYRVEECIDDKDSLEMSVSRNGIVAHSLTRTIDSNYEANRQDINVIHLYDKISINKLYKEYGEMFDFYIEKETKNSYHIRMEKIQF